MPVKTGLYFCLTVSNNRINKVEVKFGFEQSDHASVVVEMCVNEEISVGPGLIKVNCEILNNPVQLEVVLREINEMMQQVPNEWNKHTKLYRVANVMLLLKCYDIKMVKSPGCSSVGASSCG